MVIHGDMGGENNGNFDGENDHYPLG